MTSTFTIVFCGYQWFLTMSTSLYRCQAYIDESACSASIKCYTGEGSYDPATSINTALYEQTTLKCETKTSQSTVLRIYHEFAGAISCSKEKS